MLSSLNPDQPIHLAGVAGSAMSGLALLLLQRGFQVVGTDPRAEEVRARLESAGALLFSEQDGSRIPANASIVVTSAALPKDHPELVAASKRGLRVVQYAEFLGALMSEALGVAVAGTHGKTTTTAMIVSCLRSSGISPGFVIGGYVPDLKTGSDAGSSKIFVAEACEYNRSFLHLAPRIAVITNIEEDHLDIYENLDEVKEAFCSFASRLPKDGFLVHSAHCRNTPSILSELSCEKRSFGVEIEACYTGENLRVGPDGTTFDLRMNDDRVGNITLLVHGRHNVANALAATAVCREIGLSTDQIIKGLSGFRGVKRRFEVRGDVDGVTVVDDYAHHPTEIRALLDTARTRFGNRKLIAVFQPHQASRTRLLLDEFAQSFDLADEVIVPDIYSVRDTQEEQRRIHSKDLVNRIAACGKKAKYIAALEDVVEYLLETVKTGDVVLAVGAGNIDRIAGEILSRLQKS
jgi:UDP-N-acetylmuramate--alanine ligase